jgi:hypothetical protein
MNLPNRPMPQIRFGFCLGLTLLAGCAGTAQQSTPAVGSAVVPSQSSARRAVVSRKWVSAIPAAMLDAPRAPDAQLIVGSVEHDAKTESYAYVASNDGPDTDAYQLPDKQNAGPNCTIGGNGAVNDIGVQPGTDILYVPEGLAEQIYTFATTTGCGPEGPSLSDPDGQPSDVAFDASTGTVYVANIIDFVNFNIAPCTVLVYEKGQTAPSRELKNAAFGSCLGVAVDKSHNLFLSEVDSSNKSHLVEFKEGKGTAVFHSIAGPTRAGGLQFDDAGNLIVVDINTSVTAAYVYKPPFDGAPFKTIALRGAAAFGKLDKSNTHFYTASFTNGSLDVYSYPSGAYGYSVTAGLSSQLSPGGVALSPAAAN